MTDKKLDMLLEKSLKTSEKPAEALNARIKEEAEKMKNKKTNGWHILRNAAAACLCIVAAAAVVLNVSHSAASAMENIPVIGKIASALTFREYKDAGRYGEAHLTIPELDGLGDVSGELNREIEKYISGIIDNYEAEKKAMEELAENDTEGVLDGSQTFKYRVDSGYTVLCDSDEYFSIRIWTDVIMAGATEYSKIFTVDKNAGRIIALSDLFDGNKNYREEIHKKVKDQMQEKMASDDSIMYFADEVDSFEGDEEFYITENGELVIVYNEYEVAPGYMGVCEFNLGKIQTPV